MTKKRLEAHDLTLANYRQLYMTNVYEQCPCCGGACFYDDSLCLELCGDEYEIVLALYDNCGSYLQQIEDPSTKVLEACLRKPLSHWFGHLVEEGERLAQCEAFRAELLDAFTAWYPRAEIRIVGIGSGDSFSRARDLDIALAKARLNELGQLWAEREGLEWTMPAEWFADHEAYRSMKRVGVGETYDPLAAFKAACS